MVISWGSGQMRVDLVFAPFTGVTYPYLSTAVLTAYVKQESAHAVSQIDLNQRLVAHLLAPETLAAELAGAEELVSESRGRRLVGSDVLRFARCATLAAVGPTLISALPEAMEIIRSERAVHEPAEIALADYVVSLGLKAATALHPPDALDFSEPLYGVQAADPKSLRTAVTCEDSKFLQWYDALIQPGELTGDVVGLSIVYQGQVLPGLLLAQWLRRHRPNAHILIGGPFFTAHRELLPRHPWLFDLVDAFVVFEGEQPLVGYLDALESGHPLGQIPGLVFNGTEGVQDTGAPVPIPAATLPTPDFGGLPLSEYHAPAPVLPLLASRGCYWRCAFCTHHYIYGDSYRVRPRAAIAGDLETLVTKYGCEHVYFVDESISPKLIRHISASVAELDRDIRWGCELRLERSLSDDDLARAAQSGCRVLSFGLESGSQRVLDLMHKGITVAEVRRLLNACSRVGIHAHVMCIVGFPGEREVDSDETVALLEDFSDKLDLVGLSYFVLLRHSPVEQDPARYGVHSVRPLVDGFDFEERLAYEVTEGLTQAESFERWYELAGHPAFTAARARAGHGERERFLFSPGSDVLRAYWARHEADTPGALQQLISRQPARAVPHSHDLDGIVEAINDFEYRVARAYNIDGLAFTSFWEEFLATLAAQPSDTERYWLFIPAPWRLVDVDGSTLQQVTRAPDHSEAVVEREEEEAVTGMDGSERADLLV